jgi:hypothetical protein
MNPAAEVMRENPHLIPYRVTLAEDVGDKFTIVFDCFAEDDDHAIEQAENAYSGAIIHNITFFPDME